MSAEVQESGGKNGKSKQKKFAVRVDFTPMVDMNMLLITFFMLCTTLSKPQTMEISMPSNDKNITEEQKSMVKASQAITLLLGPDNKLYYYEGEPNYKDYTSLKETTYGPDGLRSILLQKNATAVNKVRALKQQKLDLNHLSPVVMLGGNGLTEGVLAEIDNALNHHELIKVKIAGADRETKQLIIDAIVRETKSSNIQTIGHVLVLYRPSEEGKIQLPRK